MIAEEIRPSHGTRSRSAVEVPPHLVVEYIVSTFVLVLNWWVESDGRLSAKEVDEVFRALVLPTVAPLGGG